MSKTGFADIRAPITVILQTVHQKKQWSTDGDSGMSFLRLCPLLLAFGTNGVCAFWALLRSKSSHITHILYQ